jgi:hypothetical protein
MPRSNRLPLLLAVPLLLVLSACGSKPPAASGQADAAAQPAATSEATELRDTIQKPIARAKGVEDVIEKSHQRENGQIDDAEGASASSPASPP